MGEISNRESSQYVSADNGSNSVLSARLMTPATIMSLILFALAFLPMASCGNSDRVIVPAKMAIEIAESNKPQPGIEYVAEVVSAIPLAFTFTSSYWVAIPCLVAVLLVKKSPRWATRIWRLLILALAMSMSSFLFAKGGDPMIYVFDSLAIAGLIVWLWSSPLVARVIGLVFRADINWHARKTLYGGFWCLAILSFAGYFFLSKTDYLLYGGRMGGIACVGLAYGCVLCARQSVIDASRSPRYSTLDLMLITFAFAVAIWRMWLVDAPWQYQ